MWFLQSMSIVCYCEELQRSRIAGKGLWHIWYRGWVYLQGILIETENSQLRLESLTTFPALKQEILGGKLLLFQSCLLLKPELKRPLFGQAMCHLWFRAALCALPNPMVKTWLKRKMKKRCLTLKTQEQKINLTCKISASGTAATCVPCLISLPFCWYPKRQPNLLLSPRVSIKPLIVSWRWDISAVASIAWEASTSHLMKCRWALHTF